MIFKISSYFPISVMISIGQEPQEERQRNRRDLDNPINTREIKLVTISPIMCSSLEIHL